MSIGRGIAATLLGALLLVCAVAARTDSVTWNAPVYNWGSGWCSTCYVRAHVDTPNADSGWLGYAGGWAFMEYDGSPVTRIDFYVDGVRQSSGSVLIPVYRHDLYPYTGNDYDGWMVIPDAPLASGTHTLHLVFWYQQVSTTLSWTVTIP